ncbi:MAG: hypothetical protein ACRDRO_06280 [Pseudonocardiaceae bacterium]
MALGWWRAPVTRPWMRAVDGLGELAVSSYELFSRARLQGRLLSRALLREERNARYAGPDALVGEPHTGSRIRRHV